MEAQALLSEALPAFWAGVTVFLRVGAAMAFLPAFGEQSVPLRIRLALALAFTLVVAPAVTGLAAMPPGPPGPGLIATELGIGALIGLLLRFFVMALQIAGTIAAQSTSLSQIFGATAGTEPLPAFGHVLVIGGLALATLAGLHVRAAEYLVQSYLVLPMGAPPAPALVAAAGTRQVARCFALAFSLAAPFMVAATLYNVTLGVINRAMPQLMVAFVGAPAITCGGLALLALSAPALLELWLSALNGFMADPLGAS